jgi:hypothetical protein
MRARVLPLVACGLLLVTGATHAAPPTPPPPADATEAKVADYVMALKSKNATVRKQVALALGELGEKAKSAVPALREALLDSDEGVQGAAAAALDKIGGKGKPAADAELKKLRDEIEAARAQAQEQAEVARAEAKVQREKAAVDAKRLQDRTEELARMVVEAKKREEDIRALREKAADEAARAAKLEKERTELRNKAVTAEVDAKLLQERNKQLEERIRELEKEIERLRKGAASSVKGSHPPPENVEGLVKSVDEKSGLIGLSVGSDAGLEKGHTLEVYRLKPSPKYLGQVEVVDVTPTQAVAKPVGKPKEALQVGDSVSGGLPKK